MSTSDCERRSRNAAPRLPFAARPIDEGLMDVCQLMARRTDAQRVSQTGSHKKSASPEIPDWPSGMTTLTRSASEFATVIRPSRYP